jgi:hypothetical protein
MTNEDSLRDYYDKITTHNDPHSPYYDGPIDDCEDEDEMEESE